MAPRWTIKNMKKDYLLSKVQIYKGRIQFDNCILYLSCVISLKIKFFRELNDNNMLCVLITVTLSRVLFLLASQLLAIPENLSTKNKTSCLSSAATVLRPVKIRKHSSLRRQLNSSQSPPKFNLPPGSFCLSLLQYRLQCRETLLDYIIY